MRYALLSLALLVLPAWGQTVTLPAEVKVAPGRLASVKVEYDGTDIRWDVPTQLDVFREYDPDPKVIRLRLIGYEQGTFRLLAVAAKDGKLSPFAACNVVVGTPLPPVPPGPGPTPPDPPSPAPIPLDGFRVLIVYESGELSKLSSGQLAALYSAEVRKYLNDKCVTGGDGKTREWRVWDKDVPTAAEAQHWQDAMKRPRASVPWVIISTGKSGYEGPMPADVAGLLALLKKYGG